MNEKIRSFIKSPKGQVVVNVTKLVGTVAVVIGTTIVVTVVLAAVDGYIHSKIDPEGFAKLVEEERISLEGDTTEK